jgi:hypothetical protein
MSLERSLSRPPRTGDRHPSLCPRLQGANLVPGLPEGISHNCSAGGRHTPA